MSSGPSWSNTVEKENNNDLTLFQRFKRKVTRSANMATKLAQRSKESIASHLPKIIASRLNVAAPWEEPSFLSYKDCRKPTFKPVPGEIYCKSENGKIIQDGDQMINFKRLTKANTNLSINYESRKRRYYRSKNYNPATGSVTVTARNGTKTVIPINETVGDSLRFYTARGPRLRPKVTTYTNLNKSTKLKHLARNDFVGKFDLQDYQERLDEPTTREAAAVELRTLKQMLMDARTMTREVYEKKYENWKMVQSIAGTLGMGLGLATGTSGISSAVTQGIGHASTAAAAASTVGTHSVKTFSNIASPALDLAGKIATSVLIASVLHLSNPGVSLAISAAVTSTIGVASAIMVKRLEHQKLTIEMNGDALIKTIDELIENHGKLVLEENPMFKRARDIKAKLNSAIVNKQNVEAAITNMPIEDQDEALTLYEQMIADAVEHKNNIKSVSRSNKTKKNRKLIF